MKLYKGLSYTAVVGTDQELDFVREILTFNKKKGSYLSSDNFMFSGLVDYVIQRLDGVCEIEVEMQYDEPVIPIREIRIPKNYIANGDPNWKDRDYQYIAARKAIHKQRGVVEIATGGGKTEISIIITKWLHEHGICDKFYFVCETQFLMEQAYSRFLHRGFEDVSCFGGGNPFRPATVQILVIDSLLNAIRKGNTEVVEDFASARCIFFDEAHHLAAQGWVKVGEMSSAPYRFGLTATLWNNPLKYSHSDFSLIGITGDIICSIPSSVLRKRGYLAHPLVTSIPVRSPKVEKKPWALMYEDGIVTHPRRNAAIVSIAQSLYEGSYKTLVFVREIRHGLFLVKNLRERGCKNVYFVKGGKTVYKWMPSGRWEVSHGEIEEIADLVRSTDQVVIVGSSVLDEGIDIPSFNALIMGTAMKKYRRTVQRIGRGMRPKPGDNSVYVFDFEDETNSTFEDHWEFRKLTYGLEEYEFSESLDKTCERMGIPILVDDGLLEFEELRMGWEERKRQREERREERKRSGGRGKRRRRRGRFEV